MDFVKRLMRGAWIRLQNIFILRNAQKILQEASPDQQYSQYLKDQLTHTVGLRTKDAAFRYGKYISKFLELVPEANKNASVVCVGCRNTHEIDAFKRAGFSNTQGVDLFSTDPQILVMDMHDLKFSDNAVDILYSAATFEKAFDPQKVAREFLRVTKNGGLIILQVGAHYQTGNVDRHDFGSVPNLQRFFVPHIEKVYFEEDIENSLATIFQIKK